jgi:hypothetical protein
MKYTISGLCLISCCLATALTVCAANGTYSVYVRKGQMRQQPSFLGQVIKELPYGEHVEVLVKNPPWLQVKDVAGDTGWMHISALTTKRLKLQHDTSSARSSATSDEIALAGKGFNQAMESAMKAKRTTTSYDWVDYMEQIVITPDEMQQFLSQGGVHTAQGGA